MVSLTALLKLEAGIQQDLDKDGFTGDKITEIITSNMIFQTVNLLPDFLNPASGGYYFDDSGTVGPGSEYS